MSIRTIPGKPSFLYLSVGELDCIMIHSLYNLNKYLNMFFGGNSDSGFKFSPEVHQGEVTGFPSMYRLVIQMNIVELGQ